MDLNYFREVQKECSYQTKVVFRMGKYDELCNHVRNEGRKYTALDCPILEWNALMGKTKETKEEDSKQK